MKDKIKLYFFTICINLPDIENRKKVNLLSTDYIQCYIYPESEFTNGNSGRNEHGTHIHIKSNDNKLDGELDILTKKMIGVPSNIQKKILKNFDNIQVKNEIITEWNKIRNNKLTLFNNEIKLE